MVWNLKDAQYSLLSLSLLVLLPLLACSVPDLQLDFLPPELDSLYLEVDSNCGDECCVKCILGKSEGQKVQLSK